MRVHWKTHEAASGETALTCEKQKERNNKCFLCRHVIVHFLFVYFREVHGDWVQTRKQDIDRH